MHASLRDARAKLTKQVEGGIEPSLDANLDHLIAPRSKSQSTQKTPSPRSLAERPFTFCGSG